MDSRRRSILLWLIPIILTVALTSALMVAGRLGDMMLLTGGPKTLLKGWLFVEDPRVAREVILAVLEVLAAIFAISITVVAIIVQLAATRYTSRVVDLFLADPLNAEPREFWEIEDRGESFYFLEKEHREQVHLFFAWLLGETPLPAEIAQSA